MKKNDLKIQNTDFIKGGKSSNGKLKRVEERIDENNGEMRRNNRKWNK